MEMMVIALVVIVAFAMVLVPLMRRRSDGSDAAEFGDAPPQTAVAKAPHGPAHLEDAGLAPIGAGPATPVADTTDHPRAAASGDDVEFEIRRYRAAVRAGTVCRKCGQANPADSAFCFECGARLPGADAKEFE